jgi:DNA-binding NarL/FixJ family response regulator
VRQTLEETPGELRELILAVAEDQDQVAAVPRIERLVDRTRASGTHVELLIDGSRRAAAAEVEHTAYRIVQEPLTNAVRHAPGAEVRIRVRFSEAELAIEIENGPCQPRVGPAEGVGHGLRGMRERAASCGGELAAAQRPAGRFLVATRLPLVGSSIRVLLADDQPLILAGLRTILQAEPDIEVIGEAHDGQQAVTLARELRPDLVLMDVRMRKLDGLAATRALASSAQADPIRVVILTTFDLDQYVYEALRAGASGFLVEDIPDDQLVAGVRAAARGDTLLAPSVTRRLIETYTRRPPAGATVPPGADELTPREREIWLLIARGLSNAEIAAQLIIGEATVKTHVARVLSKLGVRDRIQAVVLAYESGLT